MPSNATSVIEFLLHRQSNPLLTEPAPNKSELEQILQAGMSVPDHGFLTPWQFIVAQNNEHHQGLDKLRDVYLAAVTNQGADQAKLDKTAKMPYRAPVIITIATNYQEHPKVPQSEQLIAAGCAAHAMQMAASALGYGAMWRSGDLAFDQEVKSALNIGDGNDIVGFLYLGTKSKELPVKSRKSFETVTRYL